MKRNLIMFVFGLVLFVSSQSFASIFSHPVRYNPLRRDLSQLGYSHIDVADYQVDLNMTFESYIDVKLLSRSGAFRNQTGFGVFSFDKYSEEPTRFRPNFQELFDPLDTRGSTVTHVGFQRPTNLGFYLYSGGGNRLESVYRLSRVIGFYSVQALFYRNPLVENIHLPVWGEFDKGNSLSNRGYDDAVLKSTMHPTPEPSAWILFAIGLIGVSLFALVRRRGKLLG